MFKNKGFTLIEILITMAILLTIVSMVSISYISFLNRSNVNSANQTIYSLIKQAQDNAINNLDNYSQYGVYFQNNQVTEFPGNTYSSTNSLNNSYTLPPGVSISNLSPTDNNPIIFNNVTGQLTNNGISFTLGGNFYSINLNINNNGAVY